MIESQNINRQYLLLKQELLDSLAKIIAIPSVLSEDDSPTPFGKEIDRCLTQTLSICTNLGFRTFKDPDGYYGYAEVGEGEELIGILCHLDVVPVEDPENWISDPFSLLIKDDVLFGRGVSDDKGPTIVCIYAIKALMNLNINFNKRIRIIFGTDEESLWRCINRYIEKEEIPTMGFTPDSEFPVIYAEKGVLQFYLQGKGSTISLEGGGAFNAVPLSIDYNGEKQKELINYFTKTNTPFQKHPHHITISGKTAHAQSTEQGINSIALLCKGLEAVNIIDPMISFVNQKISTNPYGELLLGIVEDEVSGKLKTNLAKIELTPQCSRLYFDFRIPVTINIDKLLDRLVSEIAVYGWDLVIHDRIDPLYLPHDLPLIQTLRGVYSQVTGRNDPLITTGGATYSRAMKNFVTFGMSMPDDIATAHQTNECLPLDTIKKGFLIYTQAIAHLNLLPNSSSI